MEVLKVNDKSERWGIWEIEILGPDSDNPFTDVDVCAEFRFKNKVFSVQGFYDGDSVYKVRCMPDSIGTWNYKIILTHGQEEVIEGEFLCTQPSVDNHGPVHVAQKFHFDYEDGTRYLPIGTTCYAWTHQNDELEEQTLKTLAESPFNKIRMCVFPKHYDYNENEPQYFPFKDSIKGGWDFDRFNVEFFQHLEKRIQDLMGSKTEADWERYAKLIVENDPYGRLRSIHNCMGFYNHSKPWITHCSIQRQDVYRTAENTDEWRKTYNKPVVIDEVGYEGNINHGWGSLTGQELVRRFWEGSVRGGYLCHGETYMNDKDILWWSKGGTLVGKSVERIDFLKKILEKAPRMTPIYFEGLTNWDVVCGGVPESYYIFYFGANQPSFRTFAMSIGTNYKVDIIDTWDMTINSLDEVFEGEFKIDLPAKSYIAVRIRKVD